VLRTFAGTIAIGIGLATGVTLSTPHTMLGASASERLTATQGTAAMDRQDMSAPRAAVLGGVDVAPSGSPSAAASHGALVSRPRVTPSNAPASAQPPPSSNAARGHTEVPHARVERPLYL
jgi:hypothetical protein